MVSLDQIAVAVLLSISSILGVKDVPAPGKDQWEIVKPWTKVDSAYLFEARSKALVSACRQEPKSYVEFPSIIHGAHEVLLDNVLLSSFGSKDFKSVKSFYGTIVLKCSELSSGSELTWRAYSYSRYFSKFGFFPRITSRYPLVNVFTETLNIFAAGIMLTLACFGFLIFWKRESDLLTWTVTVSNLFLSFYFIGSISGYLGITAPMLDTHKFADLGVWIGLVLFFYALKISHVITPGIFRNFAINVAVAICFILVGSSGDVVQLGTTLPFGFTVFLSVYCTYKLFQNALREKFSRQSLFLLISLAIFLFAAVNEIIVVTGLLNSYTIFNIGCIGGLLFFILSVNEKISQAFLELADLRINLEEKVESKTEELKQKNAVLTATLTDLKRAQADLIQSEKLASLGTLAAGIAHEINNSLNYVNGSIGPMRKLAESMPDQSAKEKLLKINSLMSDGIKFTLEIIKSLRTFTGLNQAKVKTVPLKEIIENVFVLVKSKIPSGVQIEIQAPDDLSLECNVVGLNQVLINLVTNAIDAIGESGRLAIIGYSEGEHVLLKVSDTGSGIPAGILDKIFDPFFTTKEVGKGTGLGLHIVKQEIERHKGNILVESEIGKGTTFIIRLPKTQPSSVETGAA